MCILATLKVLLVCLSISQSFYSKGDFAPMKANYLGTFEQLYFSNCMGMAGGGAEYTTILTSTR